MIIDDFTDASHRYAAAIRRRMLDGCEVELENAVRFGGGPLLSQADRDVLINQTIKYDVDAVHFAFGDRVEDGPQGIWVIVRTRQGIRVFDCSLWLSPDGELRLAADKHEGLTIKIGASALEAEWLVDAEQWSYRLAQPLPEITALELSAPAEEADLRFFTEEPEYPKYYEPTPKPVFECVWDSITYDLQQIAAQSAT